MRNRQFDIGITLLLAFVLFACGASARQKTIRITYETITIADDQLQAFKVSHGKAIADKAIAEGKTREQVHAAVDAWVAKTDKAHLTIVAAYRMVAAASALNDEQSLAALLKVAALVQAQLKELGIL